MISLSDYLISKEFMIFIFFLLPFSIIVAVMPYIISKLRENGIVAKDMYKFHCPEIPVNGGLVILLVSFFAFSILSLFYFKYLPPINYAVMIIISLFGLFGLLDDNINISRVGKLILLYYCSYLIIPFIGNTVVVLPFLGGVDFGILFLQIIGPVYIAVTANLINMHSGFNGLAPGLSLIILTTLACKSISDGNILPYLYIFCLTGTLAGYFWFEKYPAKIFWGNIGALSVGSGIGAAIIIQGYIVSGIVMLVPHIINFFLYIYWRLNRDRYPLEKFGRVRDDGSLEVPNPFTLKWVLPYYYRISERNATLFMFLLTGFFCVIGFFIKG